MMRKLLLSLLPALALVAAVPCDRAGAQDNSGDKIDEMKAKEKASETPAPAGDKAEKKEAEKQVPPVQRKSPTKAKAAEAAKPKSSDAPKADAGEAKAAASRSEDGDAGPAEKPAAAGKAAASDRKPKSDAAAPADPATKADAAERPKSVAARKAPGKGKPEAEPAGAPLANCEELKNDNGLRIIIYPPSAKSARIAIFDRASNKELEKDLFSASQSGAASYARVVWGTRNTPSDRLLKGAFLISAFESSRFYEGMLMADGGDGSFMLHRAHLGKPDEDKKRWTLMLDAERSLSCRVGG